MKIEPIERLDSTPDSDEPDALDEEYDHWWDEDDLWSDGTVSIEVAVTDEQLHDFLASIGQDEEEEEETMDNQARTWSVSQEAVANNQPVCILKGERVWGESIGGSLYDSVTAKIIGVTKNDVEAVASRCGFHTLISRLEKRLSHPVLWEKG